MAVSPDDLESRLRPYRAEQSLAQCRPLYRRLVVTLVRVGITEPERLDGDARDLLDLLVLNARPRAARREPWNRRLEHDLRDAVTMKSPGFFQHGRPYKGS